MNSWSLRTRRGCAEPLPGMGDILRGKPRGGPQEEDGRNGPSFFRFPGLSGCLAEVPADHEGGWGGPPSAASGNGSVGCGRMGRGPGSGPAARGGLSTAEWDLRSTCEENRGEAGSTVDLRRAGAGFHRSSSDRGGGSVDLRRAARRDVVRPEAQAVGCFGGASDGPPRSTRKGPAAHHRTVSSGHRPGISLRGARSGGSRLSRRLFGEWLRHIPGYRTRTRRFHLFFRKNAASFS